MPVASPLLINFRTPQNLDELSVFIGIDKSLLEKAISPDKAKEKPSQNVGLNGLDFGGVPLPVRTISLPPLFSKFGIPKRSFKWLPQFRTVWQVNNDILADAYKSFSRRFDLFVRSVEKRYPHDSAYGFVRGKNILDNARGHCRAAKILHADIKDFFPSITADRIEKLFLSLGLQPGSASILTQFVTIDGALAQGLCASPMLANMVCLDLDDKFLALAKSYDCHYSRYADDITISGNGRLPEKQEIEKILNEESFLLSAKKFYISKPGQPHYVTGLSVDGTNPRAPRRMKRRVRQELYYCKKFGIEAHLNRVEEAEADKIRRGVNRIDGTIRYLAYLEKDALPKIKDEWGDLLKRNDLAPSYKPNGEKPIRAYILFVDETEFEFGGDKYLALAFALTEEWGKVDATTYGVLNDHLSNPFKGGKKEILQKKKLHYADASEDLRSAYIDKLGALPFRAYLAFKKLSSPDAYEDCYLSLIKHVLPHRFMACDGGYVALFFEENSKVKPTKVKDIVDEIYGVLEKANNRRPSKIQASIAPKAGQLCFSVPDFLLAYFSKYARANVGNACTDRERLFFESLRDKYRVILDADANLVYSRKRPFKPLV
jgi:hypothetical protein